MAIVKNGQLVLVVEASTLAKDILEVDNKALLQNKTLFTKLKQCISYLVEKQNAKEPIEEFWYYN